LQNNNNINAGEKKRFHKKAKQEMSFLKNSKIFKKFIF